MRIAAESASVGDIAGGHLVTAGTAACSVRSRFGEAMRFACLFAALAASVFTLPVRGADLPALQVSLVKDLNGPQPAQQGSLPQYFKTVGPHVYFRAAAPTTGFEVYRTDGTDDGLELAADIAPGVVSSSPFIIGAAGQRAIVLANDGSGPQFWSVSSGQATQRLTSMNWPVAPTATSVREVAQAGARLLWLANSGGPLWSSDGTTAGTNIVTASAQFPPSPLQGCSLTNTAVVAGATSGGIALGSTDGLTGVFLAEAAGASFPSAYYYTPGSFSVSMDSVCYFLWERAGGGWTLWRSDGTTPGTHEFASSADGSPAGLQVLNQQFFILDRVGVQLRLRRSSVAQPAPVQISDSHSLDQSDRAWLTVAGNHLLFLAHSSAGSVLTLYRSDGTAAGTQPLVGANVAVGDGLFALPNAVMASVGNVWSEVDVASGAMTPMTSFFPPDSARLGAARIGYGTDGYGSEVWISDGSAAGPRRLHDVYPDNPDGINPNRLRGYVAILGTHAYFVGRPQPSGASLWRSDGTEAGTEVMPRNFYEFDGLGQLLAFDDEILFLSASGFEMRLYRAEADFSAANLLRTGVSGSPMQLTGDGQAAVSGCGMSGILCILRRGDTALTVINVLPAQTRSEPIGAFNDIAVFATTNYELWRSNATAPGTFRLAAGRRVSNLGAESSVALDGKLYFVSCATDNSDCQLTFTDGTAAGTGYLLPLSLNTTVAAARFGSRMLFALARNSDNSLQLWISDGAVAGTQLLWSGQGFTAPNPPQLIVVNGYAHLSRRTCGTCTTDTHLITDGSVAGTRMLQLPAPYTPEPGFLAALNDQTVVFTCRSPNSGTELCASDPAGSLTSVLPEIFPGNGSSDPREIGRAGDRLLLGADDGRHGFELWQIRALADSVFANGFEPSSP